MDRPLPDGEFTCHRSVIAGVRPWSSYLDRQHRRNRFSTVAPVIDYTDGFTALRLYETLDGQTKVCAEIVFWDACGQFVLRTIDTDIPIEIIEDFIAKARDVIRVR